MCGATSGVARVAQSFWIYIVSPKICEIQVAKALTPGEAFCKGESLQFAIVNTN